MHELSLCRAIAAVVRPHAEGRVVDVVRLRVGSLRQVVPESLAFCWTMVRDAEHLGDAELEMEMIPAAVRCEICDAESTIESRWSVACPLCSSAQVTILAGDEFLVTSVDLRGVGYG